MPKFRASRIVRHSPQQMFDLVADIESYPQFVPLCANMQMIRREAGPQDQEILYARMSVGFKSIRESYVSRVTLDRAKHEILVTYVDGPFSHMENVWRFSPVEGDPASCTVEFYISYNFRSRLLATLMGSMFENAFRRFAAAFEERADQLFNAA